MKVSVAEEKSRYKEVRENSCSEHASRLHEERAGKQGCVSGESHASGLSIYTVATGASFGNSLGHLCNLGPLLETS